MSDTTKTADQEKDLDWREATRGKELRLTTENRELGTIIAGKPGRVAEDDNWVYHSAEFRLADGTRCFGAVLLCECDQGEHWETIIFLPGSDAERLCRKLQRAHTPPNCNPVTRPKLEQGQLING